MSDVQSPIGDEEDIEWDPSWNDEDDTGEPTDGSYPPEELTEEEIQAAIKSGPPARMTGKAGNTRLLAKEKQGRALELRRAGASYEAIAKQLGYAGSSGAYAAVQKGMELSVTEPAKELRQMQYDRLNNMLLVRWQAVQGGDDQAINTCLRIMDKMDRLMGLDAPSKTEVDVSVAGAIIVADGDSDSYIRAMKSMIIGYQDEDTPATGSIELDAHSTDTPMLTAGDIIDVTPPPPKAPRKKPAPKKQTAMQEVTINTKPRK